jgi:hypothetical protein
MPTLKRRALQSVFMKGLKTSEIRGSTKRYRQHKKDSDNKKKSFLSKFLIDQQIPQCCKISNGIEKRAKNVFFLIEALCNLF